MTPDEIKRRRQELGLSQQALAEALGVARNTVVRWEREINAIDGPRSLWLDVEMGKLKRKPGRPKRKRRTPAPGARRGEGAVREAGER